MRECRVSIGVATWAQGQRISPADILSTADRRRYAAKEAGRDRICTSGSDRPVRVAQAG